MIHSVSRHSIQSSLVNFYILKMIIKYLTISFLLLGMSDAYRILVVFPSPSKSHSILGEGFVRRLLEAKHEVTYITPYLIKDPPKDLRQVDVSVLMRNSQNKLSFEKIIKKEADMTNSKVLMGMLAMMANITIWNENVQRLLLDPQEQFDVVIAEWLYTELFSGFAAVFGTPLIWSSSIDPHGLVLSLIDEDVNPAYNTNYQSAKDPPFTFWERVEELWATIYLKSLKWLMYDFENKIFQDGFGPAAAKRGRQLPSLDAVRHNASLMFGNSHVSSGRAIRLPQNYIPIAGYHIDDDIKPLPQDLQKLMDSSSQGVIYFSLGSMIQSSSMPEEVKQGLLKVFGELKQTVIWKFEEELPNLPKNVHILKWAPQTSILAHPNCVLFISHGGLLSTTETLHLGVPVIGLPMFADQFTNVDRAVNKGFAIRVDVTYDLHAQLKVAIEEFFRNPRYSERAKELSFVYHHRPALPGAELVHWTEHVIKTGGAPHLRSPALHVPFYQKMYLDLAAVVLLASFALMFVVKRLLCSSSKKLKVKVN